MRLRKSNWLRSDEFLPHAPDGIGAQVAVDHADCPAGFDRKHRLFVRRVHNGALAYCHHCGRKGAVFKNTGDAVWTALEDAETTTDNVRSTAELRKFEDAVWWVEYYNECYNECIHAPDMLTAPHALTWLARKGFLDPYDAGAAWGAPDGETPGLMLPIRAYDGRVVGVQVRRDFGIRNAKKGPKYETFLVERADPFIYGATSTSQHRSFVLVEDYLSAIRVAHHLPAAPLYGNSIAAATLASFLQYLWLDHLIVWLDNDKPEIMDAATRIAVRAEPLFDRVTVIGDAREPTKYTDAELREVLQTRGLI